MIKNLINRTINEEFSKHRKQLITLNEITDMVGKLL